MKKFIYSLIGIAAVCMLFIFAPINSDGSYQDEALVYVAKITEVLEENKDEGFSMLKLKIQEGPLENQSITIKEDSSNLSVPRKFLAGDKVLITQPPDNSTGANQVIDASQNFYILDYYRSNALFWLFAIFILVVLWVTRYQGVGALIGMAFSFWIIFKIVLPGILAGQSAIIAAITGVMFIVPISFFLSHGFNRKTAIATFATLMTLGITALLARIFVSTGNLTGLASEELSYLVSDKVNLLDFSGLVVAGIIIGVSGILDDVTISQASLVQELKSANKNLGFRHLFNSAMRVGRDHIASMVNTLVLVYAGSALPLLLLFLDRSKSFVEVINYESVASQIIETMVGSIGLILAVPVTTFLACMFMKEEKGKMIGHHH